MNFLNLINESIPAKAGIQLSLKGFIVPEELLGLYSLSSCELIKT
jgi:hypothetical protein